uniref:DNA repair REX1-B protein n=3 Tax=Noccaea caerulescens TaxID=107243 RepID=A0A1J3HP50_NOCCA
MNPEDFQKKVSIKDPLTGEIESEHGVSGGESTSSTVESGVASQTLVLLRSLLEIQQRRAQAYAKLKRGFSEYVESGAEALYQKLCSEITAEFNECSKQVREMESLFLTPEVGRADLAQLLGNIQTQEKQKLHLTVTIQVLKKAGRPSERMLTHENCKFKKPMQHECVHLHEITEAAGTEEAEADAEFDNAFKEAIRGVQDSVTCINEYLEDIRYEIEALEAE